VFHQQASWHWKALDRAEVGFFALVFVAVLIGIGMYAYDVIKGPSAEAQAKMACNRLFAGASIRDDPAAVHKAAQVAASCAFVGNTVGGPSSYARVPGIKDYERYSVPR
jgi:hypothetical protein